jgi:hypothetical protein
VIHADFSPYKYVIEKKNIILEMCVSNRETIYSHAKMCGASGYISDSNRNAEGLLKTADNGEHIEISMKFPRADSHNKM